MLTSSAPLDRVLSHLDKVRPRQDGIHWDALCPAHDDRHRSLSVGLGEDNRVLLKCHKGCEVESIVAALNLKMSDLFDHPDRPEIVAEYNYTDEAGILLFQAVRFYPREFRQRRKPRPSDNGNIKGGWVWNLQGVRRVLYRLPELLNSDPAEIIFICEGEKDVNAAYLLGLVATTNPMGAGKWKKDYNEALRGRKVVILPDNDQPGRDHARQVLGNLKGVAASVAILELPGLADKGDIYDWIFMGGTREKLLELCKETPGAVEVKEPSAVRASGEPWDSPVPLDESDMEVDPFPLEVLPSQMAEFFLAVAESVNCPVDYPACFGLSIIAGLAGAIYAVDVKPGYVEPLSLYMCVVAPKGSGKTPALKLTAAPVYDEATTRHEEENPKPIYVSDVTVEKVAALLEADRRGVLVIRDESSGWIRSMDQYKAKGSGSDRQFWLSVNSGDPVSVHRKDPDSPPVFVRHPCVTVVGGIQPPVLSRLKGDDDGFFDRILFSYPVPHKAEAETWRCVDLTLSQLWARHLSFLVSRDMHTDEGGYARPFFLKLCPEARKEWEAWTGFVADKRNDPNFPLWLSGPAVKITGFAARLAGIIHVARELCGNVQNCLEHEDVQAGCSLGRYFLSHAAKVYRAMGRDDRIESARKVLGWIKNWDKTTFSRRDLWRSLRHSFNRPEDLHEPVKLLQAHGYVRWADQNYAGTGRMPTPLHEINPCLFPSPEP